MKNKIFFTILTTLLLSVHVFSTENSEKIVQEVNELKNDFNALTEEATQKLLVDPNYTDKIKLMVSEEIGKVKIKDEDIEEIINDINIPEKKKLQAVKELKKINISLKKKLKQEKKQ